MISQSKDFSKFEEQQMLYYYLSILSLIDGVSIYELEKEIAFQEKLQNYEACSGILKAINEAEYKTFTELKHIMKIIEKKYDL